MSVTSDSSSTGSPVSRASSTRRPHEISNEARRDVDPPNAFENMAGRSQIALPPVRRYSSTLSQWRRKRSISTNDLEMNGNCVEQNTKNQRRELLQDLFGINEKMRLDWPGTELYLLYLEEQFKLMAKARFEEIWRVVRFELPPTVSDGLRFISLVAAACRSTEKKGLSIDEVLQAVLAANQASPEDMSNAVSTSNRQAMFAVVSWLTMLVRPSSNVSGGKFHIVDKKLESLQQSQSQDRASIPIFSLFRGFGCLVPCEGKEVSRQREPTSNFLEVSTLNFFCLKTVSKVNIRWTDTLDSHLMFHQRSRTLSLFGFPTFCALNIIAESNGGSFFDQVLCDPLGSNGDNKDFISLYKREVLLSYRILFGQTERARKLFRKSEVHKIPTLNGVSDSLLGILCGKASNGRAMKSLPSELWLEPWRDFAGHLLEQQVYSADTDFPVLGSRFLELQSFTSSQKANRIWDIWRDRRNPLQWYTFWAVIVIGGLTLIISVVQTALSGAQLVASKGPSGSK